MHGQCTFRNLFVERILNNKEVQISTKPEFVLNQRPASKQEKFNSCALIFATVTKLFLISCWRQGPLAARYSPRLGEVCPECHYSLGQQSFHFGEVAV